jgi:hypothetical protein
MKDYSTLAKDEMREIRRGLPLPDDTLPDPLEVMRAYLLLKLDQGDYHGVCDAAMDMREMVAQGKR